MSLVDQVRRDMANLAALEAKLENDASAREHQPEPGTEPEELAPPDPKRQAALNSVDAALAAVAESPGRRRPAQHVPRGIHASGTPGRGRSRRTLGVGTRPAHTRLGRPSGVRGTARRGLGGRGEPVRRAWHLCWRRERSASPSPDSEAACSGRHLTARAFCGVAGMPAARLGRICPDREHLADTGATCTIPSLADLTLRLRARGHCRIESYLIKAARGARRAEAPRGPAAALGLSLGRPGRRAPAQLVSVADQPGSPARTRHCTVLSSLVTYCPAPAAA